MIAIAHIGGDGHEIWISGPSGDNPRILQEDKDRSYRALAWSPTVRRLAYMRGTSDAVTIETIPGFRTQGVGGLLQCCEVFARS